MKKINALGALVFFIPCITSAQIHVIPVLGGEMRFDDWDFPASVGRHALDFSPINGFAKNALDPDGRITLIQHEVTQDPDGATIDPPYNTSGDLFFFPKFPNAVMDGTVNFFAWAYTTTEGSVFNRHQVDSDGDHFIPKEEMSFVEYDVFMYRDATGVKRSVNFDTRIDFQPFPLSDARGWCAFSTHPLALEPMGGQVQFDLAMEVKLPGVTKTTTQVIPGFMMRSYGTLELDVDLGPLGQYHYVANAAPNNTDPDIGPQPGSEIGTASPAYYNNVSFMGGSVIPRGAWMNPEGLGTRQATVHPVQGEPGHRHGEVRADGAVWHANLFAMMPFMLRADAHRLVDYVDTDFYGELPDDNDSVDLDIEELRITPEVTLGGAPLAQAGITVAVTNNGEAELAMLPATVTGRIGETVVFEETRIVTAPPAATASFQFGPYTPSMAGTIDWSVTIDDANPDDDTVTATTQVFTAN